MESIIRHTGGSLSHFLYEGDKLYHLGDLRASCAIYTHYIMAKLRYSMDGKKTIPTESETFTDDDGAKLLIEVGKDSEEDFYIRLGSGYLSNLRIRGNGKEKITNVANCLRWIAEKLQK